MGLQQWSRVALRPRHRSRGREGGDPTPSTPVPPPGAPTFDLFASPPPQRVAEKAIHSACYAPHSSMYFDPAGKVRACCTMRGEFLGDVRHQSLREIWDGARTQRMRDLLEQDQFPAGCAFCEWQVNEGNEAIVFARSFDGLPVPDPRPEWPSQMEFSLTNTCNLQCVMCSGGYSSAIRAKREGRPPMPNAYSDEFFAQLPEFLPHLTDARFFGGEPLLGREPLRVLRMLADLTDPPRITLTTNGTILTPQVEHILRAAQPYVSVSLDGSSSATFDAIRVGAHFEDVMANLDRLHELLGEGHTMLTTCLMADNWWEFPDLLNLSSERGLHLAVNIVTYPAVHSLYQLRPDELRVVIDGLAARRSDVAEDRVNLLDHQIEALTNRWREIGALPPGAARGRGLPLAPFMQSPELTTPWMWLPFRERSDAPPPPEPAPLVSGAELRVGRDGVLVLMAGPIDPPEVLRDLDGKPIETFFELVEAAYGPMERWYMPERTGPSGDDRFELRPGGPDNPALTITVVSCREADGQIAGARYRVEVTAEAVARLGSDGRRTAPTAPATDAPPPLR